MTSWLKLSVSPSIDRATRSSSEVMVVTCFDAAGGWLAGTPVYSPRGQAGTSTPARAERAILRDWVRARPTPSMIQLAQLHKTFGDRVLLDHVTWQIGDRERVGLCGPNGAGKTTLLKMLAGIDEPDSGQVVTPSGLTVGYLPQDGLNHRGRTLLDEASHGLRRAARPEGRDARARGPARRRRACPRASTSRCSSATPSCRSASAATTATASTCGSPRCCAASASARTTSPSRPRRSRAAGRCASRWPSCCSAGPGCSCSTSRPTISISTRATGSRNTSRPTRTR